MRRSAVLLLFAFSACDPLADEKDELRAARERWDDAHIDSYSYTFEYGCFCPRAGMYAVVVEDDSVVSVEIVSPEWDDGQEPYALTVPQMFERIERALEDEPDEADLRFAPEGYPTRATFDMLENAVDDEWALGVDDFAELSD